MRKPMMTIALLGSLALAMPAMAGEMMDNGSMHKDDGMMHKDDAMKHGSMMKKDDSMPHGDMK